MENNKEIKDLKEMDLITFFAIMSIFDQNIFDEFKKSIRIDDKEMQVNDFMN